jgi:hypothetical protein
VSVLPLAVAPTFDRVTDAELHRLAVWAQRSPLPAWNTFDPSSPRTPGETIASLIAERHALRAVLETIGDFHGSVAEVLQRLGVES